MIRDDIKKVDLHMHTTVSDGTDTPCEIIDKVKNAGIDLFAVTDHDSISGNRKIINNLNESSPMFLTGVEFSCQDSNGKYHILGYGCDIESKGVNEVVKIGHDFRMKKTYDRLDFLKSEYGFEFPDEDVKELLKNKNPGKPHIGKMMVKLGYAKTKDEAINNYINNCVSNKKQYITPHMAIRGILESGGVPILAHPSYGSGNQLILGADMEIRLKYLIDMGLKGIELYYSGFTNKIIKELMDMSKRLDLLATAGSDYHGKNKLVPLGDNNLDDINDGVEGIKKFIELIDDKIIR